MESSQQNSCSVIQYYKGTDSDKADVKNSNSCRNQNLVKKVFKEVLTQNSETTNDCGIEQIANHDNKEGETSIDLDSKNIKNKFDKSESIKRSFKSNQKSIKTEKVESEVGESGCDKNKMCVKMDTDLDDVKSDALPKLEEDVRKVKMEEPKLENFSVKGEEEEEEEEGDYSESETQPLMKKGRKRKISETNTDNESAGTSSSASVDVEANEGALESDFNDEEEIENKPRRRGRCKKNPDIIPSHLSSDIVLGYKILLKFLETPQFSGFHKPFKKSNGSEDNQITCLNQIKKKFEENTYKKVCEFVNDVREMLTNIYESRNTVAIKRALRLEQVLEQRIAQLPNYLRPQCALVLSPDEVNNSHNKIRITKGGGFVSLLLEKTEKKRSEKNREKRKLLAEERKQLKEEQDKDVQEWEKNVLLKDFEEEIKSMWELPAIGHFIHLCADILNIGEVAQFEVERMLLMPQCSDTLDLIMTALLTNSLVRAKLDRTPSMPYSIWGPLVKTRVLSWYRTWHREGRNEQKMFEEIGVEPNFWQILGPDINPLDYYYFHELSLLQRVWILKTLCDVDFIRKKTVHDNIRAQTLDELNPIFLGVDRHGNRYIQLKQFCGSDMRIYRQSMNLEGDLSPSELVESTEGFEHREGPITVDKVFRDIWELAEKPEVKTKRRKIKAKSPKSYAKVVPEPADKKNLRRSVRAKQKTYIDWSDSDQSDTDLGTLKNKLMSRAESDTLYRPFSDKEFISLSVFRLPRDKVNKPTSKRSSYVSRRGDDSSRTEVLSGDKTIKPEVEERKEDAKPSGCEDEQSDSLDAKHVQDVQADFPKNFQGDDMNGDEFDLGEKINNCKLDKVNSGGGVKFVKNLKELKNVLKKGDESSVEMDSGKSDPSTSEDNKGEETSSRDKEYDTLYKYSVPSHLKPDCSKFYLVVDSVEGLRQLISKFGSHENDLEIITRNTKSKKKKKGNPANTSCEVRLIERLQNLLLELEPWEIDLMKSCRSNREKMYREYMNFINRPPDFIHPNESYWMKTYEEPAPASTTTSSTTTTTTTTTAVASAISDKSGGKEGGTNGGEPGETSQQDNGSGDLVPRKRTRVTRLQLQPENDDSDEYSDDGDDGESNESDDNWVLPTPRRRSKRDPTPRTPKVTRRSGGKKSKSSPLEKTESQASSAEKPQNSSPEKAKKALFWGPRSSDPSEDLNWETNRQKILEQHNSPIKKILFKSDEMSNDMVELEKALKKENPSTSVITASPKRLPSQIPGNKKPYFSSTQFKAMENQTKQGKPDAKAEVKSGANSSENAETDVGSKAPVKMRTYGGINKAATKQSMVKRPQVLSKPRPLTSTTVASSKSDTSGINYQPVKFSPLLREHLQKPISPSGNQVAQNVEVSGGVTQQIPGSQVQIQQPVNRVQQIQIQQPSGQTRTFAANVRLQQPIQWQPKVISVQSLNPSAKIVQQQVQTQAQVQSPGQTQVPLQNQIQVQGQIQQVVHLDPQKVMQQPIPAEKLGTVQQVVISQPQATPGVPGTPDDNLYILDGKLLVKFDNNFVQQYLQKDKVVALNVNEKLDLKKPLLIVKPETEPNAGTSQSGPSTSQQNMIVFNKPPAMQQTVVSSSVPSFVIPGNYVIKEGNQVQPQGDQQAVKIVQQAPTYVIQQKPVVSKGPQPQIFKIITSQPMTNNPNLIFTSGNISVANQVIRPVSQGVTTGDPQSKPCTLRFLRPQIVTSTTPNAVQNKINPIIVNNVVQIQGQRLEVPKTQNAVVTGRIVGTALPAGVRMAAPVQAQNVIPSTSVGPQTVRLATAIASQPVRLPTSGQSVHVQNQNVISSGNVGHQSVRLAIPNNAQPIRMAAGVQPQKVQIQNVISSTGGSPQSIRLAAQPVRVVTGPQGQQIQTQAFVPSAGLNPSVQSGSGSQTFKIVTSVQPHQFQSQTIVPVNQAAVSTQDVNVQQARTSIQPQPVQTQAIVRASPNVQAVGSTAGNNTQQVKTTNTQPQQVQNPAVIAVANLNPQSVRTATTISGQPVRLVASGQPPAGKTVNNNAGGRAMGRNATPGKGTVITTASQETNVRPVGVAGQPARLQTVVQSAGMRPAYGRFQLAPTKVKTKENSLSKAPVIIKLEDDEDEIRIIEEKISDPPPTVDYIRGELSVKETPQGWKYAVKTSNGQDVILTEEQIEERRRANNGVMK